MTAAGRNTVAAAWDAQAATLADAKAAAWPDGDDALWVDRHVRQLEAMPATGHVADIGCGWGRLALPMMARSNELHVWSVDVSALALAHLATLADDRRSHTVWTAGYGIPGDTLPPLDGAWSVLMFQHIATATQWRYLADTAALLKPGAPLVVQFVHPADPGPLSHQLHPDTMAGWCAGLELGEVQVEADRYREHTWWLHAEGKR